MQTDVRPAPDRVDGGVLPGLETVGVREVVRRLPVVEGLVAVFDGGGEGGEGVEEEEDPEGCDGLHGEGGWWGTGGGSARELFEGGIGGAHDFFGFAGRAAMPSNGDAGGIFGGGGMATTQCLVCGEASPFWTV